MNIPGQTILRKMFGLDYRSLALLRVGLATLMLADLHLSAADLRAFYTDEGVLPRSALLTNFGHVFSLHAAGGSLGFEALLIGVHVVLAALMLLGYRTQLVTIACYGMLQSLQLRNPLILFGADIALRVCFFWAMFLPLGRRYSLDAAAGRGSPPESDSYLGLPGVAYLGQFALIYLFSFLLKTGPTWGPEHTAVGYALSIEAYGRPVGAWLSQYDTVTAWLTSFTLYAEAYGPFLLILPFWSGWGRLTAIALFAILQIGFNVCMQMGLFGPVMIVVSFALLPAEFWSSFVYPGARWLVRTLERLGIRAPLNPRAGWPRAAAGETAARASGPTSDVGHDQAWRRVTRSFARGLRDALALCLLVYVVLWNVDTIPGRRSLIPDKYLWIGKATGLNQLFDLFTPDPGSDDGWFIVAGQLKNGELVNAFTGEREVSYDPPANIARTYGGQRWGAFFICLWSPDCAQHLEPFAAYLGRQWNRTHADDEQMQSIQITFMRQSVGPAHTHWPISQELLWTQSFE